jgi:hypothetical protein
MLTEEDIKEFQEMYRTESGVSLSYDEAYDSALKLIKLTEVLINFPANKFDNE